jgi:hypothetical protein
VVAPISEVQHVVISEVQHVVLRSMSSPANRNSRPEDACPMPDFRINSLGEGGHPDMRTSFALRVISSGSGIHWSVHGPGESLIT